MRLVVVGHPFMIAYNQKKYVAMKKVEPSLQLRILGPKKVRHPFMTYQHQVHEELKPDEVVPLASVFYKTHMTYLLDPVRLAATLREFRPDVIYMEEEPHALITFETVALRQAFLPTAAIATFTWDNLHRRRRFPLGTLKRKLRDYTLRRAAAVVCGNREAEWLLRMQSGYEGTTAVLPQFGLDPAEHAPGPELLLKQQLGLNGTICVGYVGRLVPEKGLKLLLDALAKLRQYRWKLLLVGSGPLELEIREQWMQQFNGRIVHVRAVPHQEVPRYLRCLDIFVLPSYSTTIWKEQFGLSLAQALMLGVPSVGSSSAAIPEVLGPGGLIFEEGDDESLRQALESLLASSARRRRLSRLAREFALRHYTLTGIAARYLAVFEQAQCLPVSGAAVRRQSTVAESPEVSRR